MTKTEFIAICGELLIDVGIALENPKVIYALQRRCTAKEVKKVLTKES